MGKPGWIFAIERGSLHDGPGIRSTVFTKGCSLRCLWCHNPESQSYSPELYFIEEKCIQCRLCEHICQKHCHTFSNSLHLIDRSDCSACGQCVDSCPYQALEIKGRQMSVDTVMKIVEKDAAFYAKSDGGLTVSGGEPMYQFKFTCELLSASKRKGIHNCLETSGYAAHDKYLVIKDLVDLFLFDFKESDPQMHLHYTGVEQRLILNNLFKLDRLGAKIILRCPLIPGLNDRKEHLKTIADISERLRNIVEINIMPYHPMGKSKCKRIGKEYFLSDNFAENEIIGQWMEILSTNTDVPVKKG